MRASTGAPAATSNLRCSAVQVLTTTARLPASTSLFIFVGVGLAHTGIQYLTLAVPLTDWRSPSNCCRFLYSASRTEWAGVKATDTNTLPSTIRQSGRRHCILFSSQSGMVAAVSSEPAIENIASQRQGN